MVPRAPSLRLPSNSHDPDKPEREWIAATRVGDHAAFEAMFISYADPLCAYVYGLLQSKEDAEEVVQEIFLWIWENRARWEVAGELRTYLYRAVRNRAISTIRRRRIEHLFRLRSHAESKADPAVVLPDAPNRVEAAEVSAEVARAVAALPERARQVFLLCRQHHMSYAEAAEVMQISPKTVENHMARAFAGLRAALGDWLT